MDGINRKPMQDVLIPQNDVEKRPSFVPEMYRSAQEEGSERIEKNPFFSKGPNTERRSNTGKGSKAGYLWFLVVASVLVATFFVMNYFASATVNITPSSWRVQKMDQEMVAVAKEHESDLVFQTASFKEEKSQDVAPTVEKKIQKKASGTVIIYNTYSGESQRLIKNTRLEAPDHRIFRINDSVVVPGAKISGGKVIEPGSIEAVVYADVPGKEYNIGLADFVIPGFKGDPRYTKFTAKSKPDSPIAGGFSGTVKVPSDEVVQSAYTTLKNDLKQSVVDKARGDLSAKDATFFPGSMIIKFEEVPSDLNMGDVTKVALRAAVTVFFFDTTALTQKLAEKSLTDYQGASLTLEDPQALSFDFLDPVDSVVLSDVSSIHFKITGTAVFRGNIDTEKIRTTLAGKDKKDFATIITNESNIAKADAVIRPMWNTKFPLDTQKINIKVVQE